MGFTDTVTSPFDAVGNTIKTVTEPVSKAIGVVTKPFVKAFSPILNPVLKPIGEALAPTLQKLKPLFMLAGIVIPFVVPGLGIVAGTVIGTMVAGIPDIAKAAANDQGTTQLFNTGAEAAMFGGVAKGATVGGEALSAAGNLGKKGTTATVIGTNIGGSLITNDPIRSASTNMSGRTIVSDEEDVNNGVAIAAGVANVFNGENPVPANSSIFNPKTVTPMPAFSGYGNPSFQPYSYPKPPLYNTF